MARHPEGQTEVAVEGGVADGDEDATGTLRVEEAGERDEDLVVGHLGEHQGAPRDPQVYAEGGLVGAVAHHVTDHGADPPVRHLDDVVEVAAEHGAGPAGTVVAGAADEVGAQQRLGQQPALEPRVLGGQQPLLVQLYLGQLRLAALDGVPDRAVEQLGREVVLDQVVLGARGDRVDAGAVVAAGEDDDRGRRDLGDDGVQRGESLRVGKSEVEQDAPRLVGQRLDALGDGSAPGQVVVGESRLAQALANEDRVPLVILDEQDARQALGHA